MTWSWIAVCAGALALVNSLLPGDLNGWWIDLRRLPELLRVPAALAIGGSLVAIGLGYRHLVVRGVVLLAALGCLLDGGVYLVLRASGEVIGLPLPLSWLFVALLLGCLAAGEPVDTSAGSWRRGALVAASLGVAFPLLQMATFGRSDYRRPADAIVVFGARAYADGEPSHALYDRMATACALYRGGYAPRLVLSGGPGDGAVHETECMRRVAMRLGVPEEAIVLDRGGLSTRATTQRTDRLFGDLGVTRVLAVSHAFHLPRIKMAYRQVGREVYTVPAHERYVLTSMPYLQAREAAAWWAYYAGAQ